MGKICLLLLGSPRLDADGEPVLVDTRKATALLAYLAVTGQPASRDTLAALLWPDSDQARARGALRRTLSSLKSAAPGDWLVIEREQISLNQFAGLRIDTGEVQVQLKSCETHGHLRGEVCQQCVEPLRRAADLFRGEFLAGFSLRDSAPFDEWQSFHTNRFRREQASILERLVSALLSNSTGAEYEEAIEIAHRWLALDPLQESAHRRLMQLYAHAGRRDAALRQYRECVRVLDQELGVPPMDETRRLYAEILEGRLLPFVEQPLRTAEQYKPPSDGPQPYVLPLAGRTAEMDELLAEVARSFPDGRIVALQGEAGIGKTRLAEELIVWVQGRGGLILQARCYEGESGLAYGPFRATFQQLVTLPSTQARLKQLPDRLLTQASRLVPELQDRLPGLPAPQPLESPEALLLFYEALDQVLRHLAAGPQPGVFFLDDLHWADSASLELLAYLARRWQGHPALLLLAWAEAGLPPDHPLSKLIAEAQRNGTGKLIRLGRLDREQVADLVQEYEPFPAISSPADYLYRETEGLPLFLSEFFTALRQGSSPTGIQNLLRLRLSGLSQGAAQALTTAAVIGRSFDFDTLRLTSGRIEEELVEALEELLGRGLIREQPDSQIGYDFAHEKIRAHLYGEISLARRRLLHRRAAEALTTHNRRGLEQSAGQVAHHYQIAGEDEKAAHFYWLAGEYARSLFANRDALAHYQSALALGHPDPARLQEVTGDLHTLLGDYTAALTSYETAAALGEPKSLRRLEHKIGKVYHRLGQWELAESHYQAALQSTGDLDNPAAAEIYADASLAAHRKGSPEQAFQLANQALALANREPRYLAQAHNLLGILARAQGDLEAARQELSQSLEISTKLGEPAAQIAALNNLALVLADRGERAQAEACLAQALSLCVNIGDRHRQAALHNNLADLYHSAGDQQRSLDQLKQSVAIYAEIGEQGGAWQPEIWKLVEW